MTRILRNATKFDSRKIRWYKENNTPKGETHTNLFLKEHATCALPKHRIPAFILYATQKLQFPKLAVDLASYTENFIVSDNYQSYNVH